MHSDHLPPSSSPDLGANRGLGDFRTAAKLVSMRGCRAGTKGKYRSAVYFPRCAAERHNNSCPRRENRELQALSANKQRFTHRDSKNVCFSTTSRLRKRRICPFPDLLGMRWTCIAAWLADLACAGTSPLGHDREHRVVVYIRSSFDCYFWRKRRIIHARSYTVFRDSCRPSPVDERYQGGGWTPTQSCRSSEKPPTS